MWLPYQPDSVTLSSLCFVSSVYIWLHWSATRSSFVDDSASSVKGLSTGTHSHLLRGFLASPCHLWPLMRDICIDVDQGSGCSPCGQQASFTVTVLWGLECERWTSSSSSPLIGMSYKLNQKPSKLFLNQRITVNSTWFRLNNIWDCSLITKILCQTVTFHHQPS